MILIADSGALYALYDADDRHHEGVRRVLQAAPAPRLVVPVAILAEIDYLLREFLGVEAELDFVESLVRGAFLLEPVAPGDLERCREVLARYRDLDLGLADAMVMVTADRLGAEGLLTVDERDFRAVVSAGGRPYRLLPADLAT